MTVTNQSTAQSSLADQPPQTQSITDALAEARAANVPFFVAEDPGSKADVVIMSTVGNLEDGRHAPTYLPIWEMRFQNQEQVRANEIGFKPSIDFVLRNCQPTATIEFGEIDGVRVFHVSTPEAVRNSSDSRSLGFRSQLYFTESPRDNRFWLFMPELATFSKVLHGYSVETQPGRLDYNLNQLLQLSSDPSDVALTLKKIRSNATYYLSLHDGPKSVTGEGISVPDTLELPLNFKLLEALRTPTETAAIAANNAVAIFELVKKLSMIYEQIVGLERQSPNIF